MAPALAEWQEQESKWKAEANAWVRDKLRQHFDSERGFEPMTAGDIMHMLDGDPSMPTGYARHVKSDTANYQERYALVRNLLEGLARQRIVVLGTTVNAKGLDRASTYARPRDASADWTIELDGSSIAVTRARAGLREWLQTSGAVLDGIDSVMLSRKTHIRGDSSNGRTTEGAGSAQLKPARRRNPRRTRGGG
jgi:hypothetical protein